MAQILFIGDLHTKTFLLPLIDKVIKRHKPDHIICMGDYMDDWDASSTENYESAQKIFAWARRHGNVTLLFGNHDMSYYSGTCDCSGNDIDILDKVRSFFAENLGMLKVAESSGNWLFTHAGLTRDWAHKYIGIPESAAEAAQLLNDLLDTPEGQAKLQAVGKGRWGYDKPGPLWADWSELNGDLYPGINQIVGHTPQRTCLENVSGKGERLWCCDTFSAYRSGERYGDGSMLLLDTEAIGSPDWPISKGSVTIIEQPNDTAFRAGYRKKRQRKPGLTSQRP